MRSRQGSTEVGGDVWVSTIGKEVEGRRGPGPQVGRKDFVREGSRGTTSDRRGIRGE